MSALAISSIICLVLIGGAAVGAGLRRILPDHHLDQHTKDVVRLGAGLLATIVGLVLGLLVSSAKSTYDIQRDEIRQLAANIVVLDGLLEQYGPEAMPVRVGLRQAVPALIEQLWLDDSQRAPDSPFVATQASRVATAALRALVPTTDAQRYFHAQAVQALASMAQVRLVLYEQAGSRMPTIFLVVVVAWLFVLFASFSLFSPLNSTACVAVAIIALSASGSVFLILEMYHPFTGFMQIDKAPLTQALAPLEGRGPDNPRTR
jgi:hypothetical protein